MAKKRVHLRIDTRFVVPPDFTLERVAAAVLAVAGPAATYQLEPGSVAPQQWGTGTLTLGALRFRTLLSAVAIDQADSPEELRRVRERDGATDTYALSIFDPQPALPDAAARGAAEAAVLAWVEQLLAALGARRFAGRWCWADVSSGER